MSIAYVRMSQSTFPMMCLMSGLLAIGCGDNASSRSDVPGEYVAATTVPSADDYFTLIGYLESLATDRADLANETEHAGFAGLLQSPAVPDAYFVCSGEEPTIRRYDYRDGSVVPGPSVSFANLGLTYPPGSTETAFDDQGLAYSVSVDQALIVVWNLNTMEIERTVELPGLARDDFSSVYPLATTLRGRTLLFPVSYTVWDTGESPAVTMLVSVDVDSNAVTLAEDTRCSGIRGLTAAPDGTLYGATDGFFAVRRRLYGDAAGTEPCVLRVLPNETRFDPSYRLASRELFDANIVGDVSISADGESVLFNAFDEAVAPIASDAIYADVARAAGWRLYRAPIGALTDGPDAAAEPVSGLDIGARQGVRFNVAGRTWAAIASADYGSSRLFDVTTASTTSGPEFVGSVSDLYAL